MNIWIINHYATDPSVGRSARHFELAKQLIKAGHRVTIFAADNHHALLKSPSNGEAITIRTDEQVKFVYLKTPPYTKNGVSRVRNVLGFSWSLLGVKRNSSLGKPDVVIGSSVHPFAAWSAQRLAKHFSVPFCFEVRDLWPQTLIDMGILGDKNPVSVGLRWLEHYLYKRAEKIIVLLPFAHEYIERFGIPRSKVLYLPNGVDIEQFPIKAAANEPKHLTVMYIGSHGQANSLDSLLDAAALMKSRESDMDAKLRWRFIGDGTEKTRLQSRASSEELDISFEPSVSRADVPELMQQADILILNLMDLATYTYGISLNKLFEYLASAKPIVFGCDARNNPVADAGAGITVAPGNAAELANAVVSIANLSAEERNTLGVNGRNYVDSEHSFASLGMKLNALLADLGTGPTRKVS